MPCLVSSRQARWGRPEGSRCLPLPCHAAFRSENAVLREQLQLALLQLEELPYLQVRATMQCARGAVRYLVHERAAGLHGAGGG